MLSLAQQLDITVCLNRKPRQLSGGQQQRVALARALVKKPSICFMDEPLSNIDPRQRENVRALMKQTLKMNGCTVIYVTHDIKDAMLLADKIYVMNKGKITMTADTNKIYIGEDGTAKFMKEDE